MHVLNNDKSTNILKIKENKYISAKKIIVRNNLENLGYNVGHLAVLLTRMAPKQLAQT
jgi:hypothetical protein